MKKSWQRALSLLLTILMVTSLLVVPAAADASTPGTKGYKWTFTTADGFTEAAYPQSGTGTYKEMGIGEDAGFHTGIYCLVNNGGSVTIPVKEQANVEIRLEYGAYGSVTDGTTTKQLWGSGTNDTLVFPCESACTLTLNSKGTTYIRYIELTDYSVDATLKLNSNAAMAQVGGSDATLTAEVANTSGAVTATSANPGIATASASTVANGKSTITISPVAEGTTTVTVAVEGTDLEETINVTVYAEDYVRTVWDWANDPDLKAAGTVQSKKADVGTVWPLKVDATSGKLDPIAAGYAQFNDGTVINVPVDGQTGQKAKVRVTMYSAQAVDVGGVEICASNKVDTAENVPVTDGYITVTSKGGYIVKIEVLKVTGDAFVACTKTPGCTLADGHPGECDVPDPNAPVIPASVSGKRAGNVNDVWDFTANDFTDAVYNSTDQEAGWACPDYWGLKFGGGAMKEHDVYKDGALSQAKKHVVMAEDGTITVPVAGRCDVEVTYTWSASATVGGDASTEIALNQNTLTGGKNPTVYQYTPKTAGTVEIKALGSTYVTKIRILETSYVEEKPPVSSADKRIGVWDIAGKQESNTDLYTNHIAPADWAAWTAALDTSSDAYKLASGTGTVYISNNNVGNYTCLGGEIPGQTIDLNGLVITGASASKTQCRIFSSVSNAASGAGSDWGSFKPGVAATLSGSTTSNADTGVYKFNDSYTSAGGYVAYGAGGGSRRYIVIKGVQKGERVTAYVGTTSANATFGTDDAAVPETVSVTKAAGGKLSFIAPATANYKIYETENTNKPVYCRVEVAPPVTVSGTIAFPQGYDGGTGYTLKFVDADSKVEYAATVNKSSGAYTVELPVGCSYNAVFTGVAGYGFTMDSRSVTTATADITTGKTLNPQVEVKSQYTYSGTISGFASGYDVSNLVITATPTEAFSTVSDPVELTITGSSFTAKLDPGTIYNLSIAGANDYRIKSPASVTKDNGDLTGQSIVVETVPTHAVRGDLVVLDVDDQFAPLYPDSTYAALPDGALTKLVLKNVEDNYTYEAAVSNGSYSANLRDGAYAVVATATGYTTIGHVVVNGADVEKGILFKSTAAPASVPYAADIYVDPANANGTTTFKTVTGAMAYIKRMSDKGDKRVTVHIAPGTYREQISIDSKNVTFVNANPAKEVKLTWYYGIGYLYYSASGTSNLDSWYDAEKAFDRYSKPNNIDVARWGCTVRVQAPGFLAENITFENSFNYDLTDEELLDGVEPVYNSDSSKMKAVREVGVDVTRKSAANKQSITERAAVLWVDTNSGRGDTTELYGCKFLSSQDTVVTGNKMYFKDCFIEGMTDYICGPGDCVFDSCTLNWKGYKDVAGGGYITAPQTTASEKGYLFRNCVVTDNNDLTPGAGGYLRMWGKLDTKAIFLNTVLQSENVLTADPWNDMGWKEKDPADANVTVDNCNYLREYNTTLMDGTEVPSRGNHAKIPMTKAEADAINVESYFGSWTPVHYVKETASTVALAAAPTVTDNGDINLPKPGHTLTVSYTLTPADAAANDNSTIQWYTVKDSAETLVKTVVGAADKTYQIQTADIGTNIKVVVTPKTKGGLTGEAQSFTVVEYVREGFDDPTGSTDPVLGKGVNVFLAGDSTVKDYSPDGMETNGVNQTEGSWGEWLQRFFNDKVTVVNYAQGGRTTRQFITDGRLDRINAAMKEGDFLFIQFGHNDCHTGDNRYVPLGIAKNAAQKSYAEGGAYPDSITLTSDLKVGSTTLLEAGTHTTYTGYLKQYIAVTEAHGATAVLMTPVARMYYSSGKIRTHHDATAVDGTTDNEYCKAVKWVYDWAVDQGYKVEFIDNYTLTASLFEKAYADGKNDTYGKQLMGISEGTHNSKLGGVIWAGVVAQAIQNSDMTIAKAVQFPSACIGRTPENEVAFTIGSDGTFAAFDNLTGFVNHATYWEGYGKTLFDAIATKAAELNPTDPGPVDPGPNDPTTEVDTAALNEAIEAAEALGTITVATAADQVAEGVKWMTSAEKTAFDSALKAAKALGASATQAEVDAAKGALEAAAGAVKTGTKCELTLGKNKVSVSVGSTATVTATVVGYVGKTLDVWSDNESVATATVADGKITIKGVAEGKAYVYAVMEDTNASLVLSAGSSTAGGSTIPAKHIIEVTVTAKSAPAGSTTRPSDRNESTTTPSTGTETGTGTETTAPAATPAAADAVAVVKSETTVKDDGTKVTTSAMSDGSEVVKEVTQDGDVAVAVTTEDGEKIIDIDVPADIPAADTKFVDVSDEHWAAKSIDRMAALGMVKGTGDDHYSPDGEVTRATLATMLFRFANGAEGKENKFADVQGHWAADAIAWAADAGVVNGISADAFVPDAEITREQMAVMLLRFAKLIGMDASVDASAAMGGYTDVNSVDSWAAEGMAWCVKNGIINGTTNTTLSPVNGATRAQTAVMLDRFIGLLSK